MRIWPTTLMLMLLPLGAAAQRLDAERLSAMDLAALLEIRVIGVQLDLGERVGASAITIIDGEDIRRSGYRHLAEILRLAPGVHVGQTAAVSYAVSARGFNGGFADKMEVLLDGRRLQTPLYLGVEWALQDHFLDDIERIEVIRGPGGAQWGVNAVNGIVNIVTRSARDTHGSLLSSGFGTRHRAWLDARHGGAVGDLHYRVWLRSWRLDESEREDGTRAPDGTARHQIGWRLDRGADPQRANWNLQGDVWGRNNHDVDTVFEPGPPQGGVPDPVTDRFRGANLVLRHARRLDDGGELRVQSYLDWLQRDAKLLGDERLSASLSLIHDLAPIGAHRISIGGGWLHSADDVNNSFTVQVRPQRSDLDLLHAFVQDRITLSGGRAALIVGSKLSWDDFSGFNLQPQLRWTRMLSAGHALWASASQAVRLPSRLDRGVRFIVDEPAPDVYVAVFGDDGFDAERLTAFEAGWRHSDPAGEVSLSLFANAYRDLRWFDQPAGPIVEDGVTFLPLTVRNGSRANTHGAELSLRRRIGERWQAGLAASWFEMSVDLPAGAVPTTINASEDADPATTASVWLRGDPLPGLELDLRLRHVGALDALAVDAYQDLDLRAAWSLRPGLWLELVGQNLLHDHRLEYRDSTDTTFGPAITVERQARLGLRWQFGGE